MATNSEDRTGRIDHAAGADHWTEAKARQAMAWYRRAEQGDTAAICWIAQEMRTAGDLSSAAEWYRQAAMTSDVTAMRGLAFVLQELGDLDEAESWLRIVARSDDADAMYDLGLLLEQRGQTAEAEAWFRRAAAEDNVSAMVSLAIELEKSGRAADAEIWWRLGAESGDAIALVHGALQAHDQGDDREAEARWQRALRSGALSRLLAEENLSSNGDQWTSPALWWLTLTWNTGGTAASQFVGMLGASQDSDGYRREFVKRRRWRIASFEDPELEDASSEEQSEGKKRQQFEQFYLLIRPELREFARKQVYDDISADEAVQDAMLRMLIGWNKFHTFTMADLRRYAFRSVRWAIQDRARARYRERTTLGLTTDLASIEDPAVADTGVAELIAEETGREIFRILTPRERELMTRVVAGKSTSEIAAELGMKPPSVARLIHRARQKISSELSQRQNGAS